MTRAAQLAGLGSLEGSAPAYACRAWVNFNGQGTVAIRASGNVSSITDLGTGTYEMNFSTSIVDTNYNTVGTATGVPGTAPGLFMANLNRVTDVVVANNTTKTTFSTASSINGVGLDCSYVNVVIFR